MTEETVESRILDAGYEDVVIFGDNEYSTAFIGMTDDGRAVYDYDLMVEWLMETDHIDDVEAMEWIDYNTIRSLPYIQNSPIIVHRI